MEEKLNLSFIPLLILAYLLTDLILPLIIKASGRIGAIDKPGGHKAQKKPIPFLGGTAIFLTITLCFAFTLRIEHAGSWRALAGILIGGGFVLALGLVDDYRPVNAVLKLLLLFLASAIVMAMGISATIVPGTWGILINIIITLLWVAGITSAFNSIDNNDGAAGGTVIIASAGMCIITLLQPPTPATPYLVAMTCVLMGSCAGFLRHNWPKARIYLGDNGSFFLGFTLSCMLLYTQWTSHPIKSMAVPCVLMTVPILDIALSTFLRIQQGVVKTLREAIVYCGHDHLAHRFRALGLSRPGASCAMWSMGIISAVNAIILCSVKSELLFWSVITGHGIFVLLVSILLSRTKVYSRQDLQATTRPPVMILRTLHKTFGSHLPRMMETFKEDLAASTPSCRAKGRLHGVRHCDASEAETSERQSVC